MPDPKSASSDSKSTSSDSKSASALAQHRDDAPPPDYVWRLPAPPARPPALPHTNRVHIAHEHPPARGAFVLDPALVVPPALLADAPTPTRRNEAARKGDEADARKGDEADARKGDEDAAGSEVVGKEKEKEKQKENEKGKEKAEEDGEERPNLRMSSVYAGVDADIWVLDSSCPSVRLQFDAEHGRVCVRLHALGTRPCTIEIRAGHGAVDLLLPRDFSGRLIARTVHARTAVPALFTRLGEAGGEERYYCGDVGRAESAEAHAVTVTAPHGKISVSFEGDGGPADKDKGKGKGKSSGSWFS